MIFDYSCPTGSGISMSDAWVGQAQLLTSEQPYEIKVTARGSCFYVICGSYVHGNYLCIPSSGIASELASLADTFWNLERFTSNCPCFSPVDAISIVYALKAVSSYVDL